MQSTAVPAPASQLLPSLEKDEPRKSFGIKVQNLPVRSTGTVTCRSVSSAFQKREKKRSKGGLNKFYSASLVLNIFLSSFTVEWENVLFDEPPCVKLGSYLVHMLPSQCKTVCMVHMKSITILLEMEM